MKIRVGIIINPHHKKNNEINSTVHFLSLFQIIIIPNHLRMKYLLLLVASLAIINSVNAVLTWSMSPSDPILASVSGGTHGSVTCSGAAGQASTASVYLCDTSHPISTGTITNTAVGTTWDVTVPFTLPAHAAGNCDLIVDFFHSGRLMAANTFVTPLGVSYS